SYFGTHAGSDTLSIVGRYVGLHDELVMLRHDVEQRFAGLDDPTYSKDLEILHRSRHRSDNDQPPKDILRYSHFFTQICEFLSGLEDLSAYLLLEFLTQLADLKLSLTYPVLSLGLISNRTTNYPIETALFALERKDSCLLHQILVQQTSQIDKLLEYPSQLILR